MRPTVFQPDFAATAWQNLFDFLEPPAPDCSSADRGENDAVGGLKKRSPTRRERAHAKYEEVFCRLTAYFDARGCDDSEGCASETILRVAAKCGSVELTVDAKPMSYFYGCARNVMHEVYKDWKRKDRKQRELLMLPAPEPSELKELRQQCLEDCMSTELGEAERELILDYYRGEHGAKIEGRIELARRHNKGLNALRIETFRIRKKLQPCVSQCLENTAESMVPQ